MNPPLLILSTRHTFHRNSHPTNMDLVVLQRRCSTVRTKSSIDLRNSRVDTLILRSKRHQAFEL